MKAGPWGASALGVLLAGALSSACSQPESVAEATAASRWSPEAAATYLDQRASWWAGWQPAARDHETFCVSCHTALPYALARPALRPVLDHAAPPPAESRLLDNVVKRVRLWDEVGPYYAGQVEASRGTEAVLNALILATRDAGKGRLSEETHLAFDHMWAEQHTTGDERGAWSWLDFGLRPWEAPDSPYFGAALAALAVGTAPEEYGSSPAIRPRLQSLREYLDREYANQSLLNRTVLLWASARLPRLITPDRQESLIAALLDEQRADGGWSSSALNRIWRGSSIGSYARSWIRSDLTLVPTESDGYATGLVTFALELVGTSPENDALQRGLAWLERNQNRAEGSWPAHSLNRDREPSSGRGRFMSDAATAYAALALARAEARGGSWSGARQATAVAGGR